MDHDFEPYEAYRSDPKFHMTVNIIARDEDMEPVEVISKGLWKRGVSRERLGIID